MKTGKKDQKVRTTRLTAVVLSALVAMLSPGQSLAEPDPPPQCTPTICSWECLTTGSVDNPGALTASSGTICLGGSVQKPGVGTATFSPGSKKQKCVNPCATTYGDPVTITYTQTNWFEPELPNSFTSCGQTSYTNYVKGVDADCSSTEKKVVGTFTVTVLKAEVKAVVFTSDHGVLTSYTTDFAGNGGTIYNPRGWQKSPAANNPVTHTKGTNSTVTVTISVCPAGLAFDLEGTSSLTGLTFHKTGLISTGGDQTVSVTSDGALPAKVDVMDQSVIWKVTVNSKQCDAGTSGPHKVYLLWDTPIGTWTATRKRIDWICTAAKGSTTIDTAEAKLHDELVQYYNLFNDAQNPWLVLDGGSGYDCRTLAMCHGLASQLLGIPAMVKYAYPSTDADCSAPEPIRLCSGGTHGLEKLGIQASGGWNQYQACCVVNDKWYPAGLASGPFTSALAVIRDWLGGIPYQAWVYSGSTACSNPGPNPVPDP